MLQVLRHVQAAMPEDQSLQWSAVHSRAVLGGTIRWSHALQFLQKRLALQAKWYSRPTAAEAD